MLALREFQPDDAMTSKLLTLAEAARRHARDGIQYASGAALPIGSDAVIFGRELLRQGRRDLHAVFHCNTQQLNLLAAAGAVRSAECGFSGLEVFGFANGLRRRVESGEVLLEDYSNLSMALRLLAGALNWPFAPATVNLGSDIAEVAAFPYPDGAAKIPLVENPFGGPPVGALRPLRPDLAAIHVSLADPSGNAIMLGTEWSRFELSRAAKTVVLIADAIVDPACVRQFPNLVRIPDVVVSAVVHWPFAAWPQSSPGFHDLDEEHMKAMNAALGSDAGTRAYLDDFVYGWSDLPGYLDRIGADVRARLAATGTGFLLDPFRRWILPDDAVAALTEGTA